MGVYGKTYKSAFSGLGKPSIKLEFEDNDQLLAFQQRMQEAGEGPDAPDDGGGNFTPGDRVLDSLSRLATGRPYLKATPGGEMTSSEEPVVWNEEEEMFVPVDGLGKPGDVYMVTDMRTRSRKEPGELLANKNLNFKAVPTEHIYNFNKQLYELTKDIEYSYDYNKKLKDTGFTRVYVVYNKDTGKCIIPILIYNPYKLRHDLERPTFDGSAMSIDVEADFNKVINFAYYINNRGYAEKYGYGYITDEYYNELFNVALRMRIDEYKKLINKNFNKKENEKYLKYFILFYSNLDKYNALDNGYNQKRDYFKAAKLPDALGAPGDVYLVTDTRKKPRKELDETTALKKYNIRPLTGEELQKMQEEDPLLYEQIKSDITTAPACITPAAAPKVINDNEQKLAELKKELIKQIGILKKSKGAQFIEAQKAAINAASNIRRMINGFRHNKLNPLYTDMPFNDSFDHRLHDGFVKIVTTAKDAGDRKMFDELYEKYGRRKNFSDWRDLGRAAANDALYNNNDIIDTRGLKPTYKILADYSQFFAPAQHSQTFAGVGLDDTLKLIKNICKAHYKDCAKIAAWLKGDCKMQSAFNLWHWMRNNIRYEYDREGREEVRTPLRTWADRNRGVDCDCLSVFAWCVLKCMGYDPAFELVAFKNRPQYSHIFVNLDGIVVDRVWFVFNSRPPMVTNSRLYRIDLNDNLGKLF